MMNSKSLVYTVLIYKVLHKPKHHKLTAVAAKEADRESAKQICGLKIKLLVADRSSSKVFPLNRVLDLVPFFPLSYWFCR